MSWFSRRRVPLVTQAPKPKSEDIGYRQRRYLLMMGIRVACFLIAIFLVTQGFGWWAAIPAAGAVAIPYFAVVFANGGREPNDTRGFREYRPQLPAPGPAAARPHLRQPVITPARQGEAEQPPATPAPPVPARPLPADQAADEAAHGGSGTVQSAAEKQPANG